MPDDIDRLIAADPEQIRRASQTQPRRLAKAYQAMANIKRDNDRRRYEESFEWFIMRAWQEIDPSPLDLNWHHQVIADHLVGVMNEEIRNLIINIPPRCGKTILTNVLFPAWVWCQPPENWGYLSGPHVQFLCVCYGATLSEEIAVKMRRLVTGDWYQGLWGDRVSILPDQQARANFGNTAGGARISSSIEGGLLGRGGDLLLVDDPLTPKEANSQIERERVMRDIREGLATRLNNAAKAARIMIMQRLHLNDPTSYALESWKPNVHLMFPMRYETRWPCDADIRGQITPNQLQDMGRDSAEGLLLWPTRFTEKTVASLEVELGTFGTASQLQQYPVPRSGGIVGEDDWMIWPEDPATVDDLREFPGGAVALPLPEVTHVVLLLDTAMSEKETADYNACVVMGVWYRKRKAVTYQRPTRLDNILLDPGDYTDDGEQPRVILMGAWRMRAKLNDETKDAAGNSKGVVQRVIETARRFHVDRIIIENKTRGLDVRNEIQRQLGQEQMSLQLFNPKAHGDKLARLASVQPLFEQKLIYAPANVRLIRDRETGESRVAVNEFAWVRAVVDEVATVPRGAHDDYSDCCLVAGTLISTRRGDVPIEDIQVGDNVFTPIGWRKVLNCGPTGEADVIEALGLRGTPEHPVFSLERGYQTMDSFSVGLTASRLSLCGLIQLTRRSWLSSRAQPIASWEDSGGITCRNPAPTPAELAPKGSTSLSGRPPMAGASRRATRSITGMVTRSTVILATWSAYRRTCIAVSLKTATRTRFARLSLRLRKRPSCGTAQRLAASGTGSTPPRAYASPAWRRLTAKLSRWINAVIGAATSFRPNDGFMAAFAASPAAPPVRSISVGGGGPCIRISPLKMASRRIWSAPIAAVDSSLSGAPLGIATSDADERRSAIVYNLQVEEAECYYANGVLVHNCSMGLITLRTEGYLELTKEYLAGQIRARMFRGQKNTIRESYGV